MASSDEDFRKEFKEMGRERVRSDLMYGRMSTEKQRAARMWLEQADAENWQRQHAGQATKSLMQNELIKKYLPYVGAGIFLVFALSRLFLRQ